jgi:hypothetical protein
MRCYGHVVDELEDAPKLVAEDAIRASRAEHVSEMRLLRLTRKRSRKCLLIPDAPSRIRTCGLLLRRESLCPAELSGPGASLGR